MLSVIHSEIPNAGVHFTSHELSKLKLYTLQHPSAWLHITAKVNDWALKLLYKSPDVRKVPYYGNQTKLQTLLSYCFDTYMQVTRQTNLM